jgi:hypothetical protein
MKSAFVIITNGDNWWDEIALNYSQLSLDYSATSRLDSSSFEYIIAKEIPSRMYQTHDLIITVQAGTIFLYGMYERFFTTLPEIGMIKLADGVVAHQPAFKELVDLTRPTPVQVVSTISQNDFAESHASLSTNLIDDSNMTYFMHNEFPVLGNITKPLKWAATVSSGFFINTVMDHHKFDDDCKIHHFDISKISLQVRQYTIENWNGKDVFKWIAHLHDKFPSIQLFNKGKLTERDPSFKRIWQGHIESFGEDKWLDHWQQYVSLDHEYYRINISNINDVKSMFANIDTTGQGAIWWNGAMKRSSANIMKTSEQSHAYAIKFITYLHELDPDMICYGSDHCALQFDGLPASECSARVSAADSRAQLWSKVI